MAVIVGILNVRMVVWQATSLKDKRRVVQSILQRTRNQLNVCAVESGTRDERQHASLYFAYMADSRRQVESTLTRLANRIQQRTDVHVIDFNIETF